MRLALATAIILMAQLPAAVQAQSVYSYADTRAIAPPPHAASAELGRVTDRAVLQTFEGQRAPTAGRPSPAHQWRLQGDQHREARAYAAAEAAYTQALAVAAHDTASLYGRGASRHAAGDIARAIEDYDAAARLRPRWSAPYKLRATARLAQGLEEMAIADFKRALEYEAKDVDQLTALGLVRLLQGENEIALGNLVRAVQFKDDAAAMLLLHLARMRMGEASADELRLNAERLPASDWKANVIAHYQGKISRVQLMGLARNVGERCLAAYYGGLRLLDLNRRADGLALLQEAALACDKTSLEFAAATFDLKRRGK